MLINNRHTGIVVNDIDSQVKFYIALGFVIDNRDIEEGDFIDQVTGISGVKLEWVKLKLVDGFILELLTYHSHSQKFDKLNASSNKMGISHLAFTVSNIDETCSQIQSLGGSIVNKPALAPNLKVKVAYCHDPEGVLMEIVEVL